MADSEQHRRVGRRAEAEKEPLRKRAAPEANPGTSDSNKKARWEQEEQVRAARLAAQALQPASKAKDVTNRHRNNRSRRELAAESDPTAGGDSELDRWQPNDNDRWMPSSSPACADPQAAAARYVANSALPDASHEAHKGRTGLEFEMQPVKSRDPKKSTRKQDKLAKDTGRSKDKRGDADSDKAKKQRKEEKNRKPNAVQDTFLYEDQGLNQDDKASTPVDASGMQKVSKQGSKRPTEPAEDRQRRRSSDREMVGVRTRQPEPFAGGKRQHLADRDEPLRDQQRQQSPAERRQQDYVREQVEQRRYNGHETHNSRSPERKRYREQGAELEKRDPDQAAAAVLRRSPEKQRRYNGHETRNSRSPERERYRGQGAELEKRYLDKAAAAVLRRSPERGPSPRRLARGPQLSLERTPVDSSPAHRDRSPMQRARSPFGYQERSPDDDVRLRRGDVQADRADSRFAEAAARSRGRSYNDFPPDDYHARAFRDFANNRDEREVREQPEQHRAGPDEHSRQRPLHEHPHPGPDIERFAGRGKSIGRGGWNNPGGRGDLPPFGMPFPGGPRGFSGFPGPRGFAEPRMLPRGMGAPPGFMGPDVALPEDMRGMKGMPRDSRSGPQPKPRREETPRARTDRPHPDRKDHVDSEAGRSQDIPSTPHSSGKTPSARLEPAATSVAMEDKAVPRGPPRLQLQAQQLLLATAHVSRALAGEDLYRECMAILGQVDQTTAAPDVEAQVNSTQSAEDGIANVQRYHEEFEACLDQYQKPLMERRVVPSHHGFFTVPSQELAVYLSSCHASTNLWSTLGAVESTQKAVHLPIAPQTLVENVGCPAEAGKATKELGKDVHLAERINGQLGDEARGIGQVDTSLLAAELAASDMPDSSYIAAVDEAIEEDAVMYSSEDDDPASGPLEGMADAEYKQGSEQQASHVRAKDSLSLDQGTPAEVTEDATAECGAAEQPECKRN